MEPNKRVRSIAQVRGLDDQLLTECYVIGIGFTGMSAVSEAPVAVDSPVLVDMAFVNAEGKLEAATVSGHVVGCRPRPGAHLINVSFSRSLADRPSSGLADLVRREMGESPKAPRPPRREGLDEDA